VRRDSGGSTQGVGSAASEDAESAPQRAKRLLAEWWSITSSRRLFVALSEGGTRGLENVAADLGQAAQVLSDPRCRTYDELLALVAERREALDQANALLDQTNKERRAEGLALLEPHPWLGPIHEIGLYPFERVLLAGTVYEIWVEASRMIGDREACGIIRRHHPQPPPLILERGRIPGTIAGRSKGPSDKNPRNWPHTSRSLGLLKPGKPAPFNC